MSTTDDSSSTHPWKRDAYEARRSVSDALIALPSGYPPNRMLFASESHQLLHQYLLEYRGIVKPYEDELELGEDAEKDNLWEQHIHTVGVPEREQDVRLDAGDADVLRSANSDSAVLNAVFGQLDMTTCDISLATLEREFVDNGEVTVTVRGWVRNQGQKQRTIREPLYIPPKLARKVRDQLDACLVEFAWAATIESTPRTEISDELMQEVEQWHRANVQE